MRMTGLDTGARVRTIQQLRYVLTGPGHLATAGWNSLIPSLLGYGYIDQGTFLQVQSLVYLWPTLQTRLQNRASLNKFQP